MKSSTMDTTVHANRRRLERPLSVDCRGHGAAPGQASECCCADEDRLTDFDALHSRVNDDSAFAYAFDLLMMEKMPTFDASRSATAARGSQSYCGRQAWHPPERAYRGDGAVGFDHACKLGCEGIVSKRIDAPYRSGRARTWIKVRNKMAPAYTRIEDGSF
jgi:hypothetical protein